MDILLSGVLNGAAVGAFYAIWKYSNKRLKENERNYINSEFSWLVFTRTVLFGAAVGYAATTVGADVIVTYDWFVMSSIFTTFTWMFEDLAKRLTGLVTNYFK